MADVRATEVPDNAPDEVKQRAGEETRTPVTDPTLGVKVKLNPTGTQPPRNRLVVIGDSLTHGFQSGAVFNTDLSYGAIIAHELGWLDQFRYPRYPAFGGLPFNIEYVLRELENSFGATTNPFELPFAVFKVRNLMNDIEEYWERGPGAVPPNIGAYNHALAVFSWDLRDALEKTAAICTAAAADPTNNLLIPMVDNAADRSALRVYPGWSDQVKQQTLFDVAKALGDDRDPATQKEGIETLVVFLGANNALGSVVSLQVKWSQDPGYADSATKRNYTVWDPEHFRKEFDLVVAELEKVNARNVILCTVPHVTIIPVARGVGTKSAPGSRYFDYYTRPWITDADFDPLHDPHITGPEARAVDYAIDLYNEHIEAAVKTARDAGRNWYLFDIAGVLDRLAWRRYINDPSAAPPWWSKYPLPPAFAALTPEPDTQFLTANGQGGRRKGGLISLDGIHPTTVAYGIVAQELINIMQLARVEFTSPNGAPRTQPVAVDFDRLIGRDSLVNAPPQNINSTLDIVGWLDQTVDVFSQFFIHH